MLAAQLKNCHYLNPVVIALPRGGIPVALEVSKALNAPIDILVVRKLAHPLNPEFGIGAITEGNEIWLAEDTIPRFELPPEYLKKTLETETQELERRVKKYRRGRAMKSVKGSTAVLVDDGMATGVTARVAARFLKNHGAKKVVLAIPVCSPEAAHELRADLDEIISVNRPHLFRSVGQYYVDFPQLSDEEVMVLLDRVKSPESSLSVSKR